ncbi:aldo/keto reductase [Amnibacterium kyonggiense]
MARGAAAGGRRRPLGPRRGRGAGPRHRPLPGRIDAHLAAAARRLGRVDLGWLRGADAETPVEDTLQALAGAIEDGRLRGWGAGDVDARALEALLAEADRAALPRPVLARVRLNLLERDALRDLAPLAGGEGVALLAGAPLGAGRLTGRHVAAEESAAEAIRFGAPRDAPIDPALDALVALRDLARELDLTLEGMALAWLLSTGSVASTVATPRAKADWDPVHEALERPLDAETVERLESLLP